MKLDFEGKRFLLVDDNPDELRRLSEHITALGGKWLAAGDFQSAVNYCEREPIDTLITDIHLHQELLDGSVPEGIKLLEYVNAHHPHILAFACSGDPRLDTYHKAAKAGALYYLTKPIKTPDALLIAYREGFSRKLDMRLDKPIDLPRYLTEIFARYPEGIVMPSESRSILEGIALYPENTLILTGETGTGKEQAAKLLHRFRCKLEGDIPLIAVNCAAIDPGLATSLLFGHKKGAFSSAHETTNGFIGDADGGILFLDEIHCLDLKCQHKLLRVLNDGSYERLGDTRTLMSRFQLITASTKNLDRAVEDGGFLIDLFMRISGGVELHLPPLRERLYDIPAFVGIFLANHKVNLTEVEFRNLCKKLQTFTWKGNIRQLFKMLQSWLITAQCRGVKPNVEYLPFVPGLTPKESAATSVFQNVDADEEQALTHLLDSLRNNRRLETSLETLERFILQKSLERNKMIGETAAALGISRSNLDTKRKRYKLD